MPKWVKLILAILLLPACAGSLNALGQVARASVDADTTWVPIACGAGCWLTIYLLLPKPMLVYVFGHELTHALWTWMMGGRVKRFKAAATGGHVVVTRDNFLISLAPYFFPLYALIVMGLRAGGVAYWGWSRHAVWFDLLLGAAYGFHCTLTWHVLKAQQSDVTRHGYVFSGVVIFLGNVAVLLVAIPTLAPQVPLNMALSWWWESVEFAYTSVVRNSFSILSLK